MWLPDRSAFLSRVYLHFAKDPIFRLVLVQIPGIPSFFAFYCSGFETMAAAETEQQITLKLMVIKEQNKVLFAEAGKDFVDVLFSLLTLPLGTIARLMSNESIVKPTKVALLNSLYQSVENLDKECMCTDACKEMLLRPRNSMELYCRSLKLNIDDTKPTEYFVCNNLIRCRHEIPVLVSTFENKRCRCGNMLDRSISPETSVVFDGFVKSNGSFMITDELKVLPSSLDDFFSLLKDSGIKDMSSLNEMTVAVTKDQVIDLLKSGLFSKTSLTDLFLEKRPGIKLFTRIKFCPSECELKANGSSKIMVKVMRSKSKGNIVFAQGKKDFADFLFSLLTIPLGGVMHLMEGCSSIGSIDVLYRSVVDLDEDYWTTKEAKNKLVNPVLASQFKLSNLQLPIYEDDVPKYFCYTKRIGIYPTMISRLTSAYKEIGNGESCTAAEFVDPISDTGNSKGYAKGPTMYMATDDLVVMPMSSISAISLLESMSISVDDLEEKEVNIGKEEGVRILHASLTSTSALTTGLSHLFSKVKKENCN